ncbi:hypothetical protein INT45_014078 [Circinella minor]|uniref:Uncharacterized protein n=1 Tax=Circinella minor TaxID=1195481 RepID=A0A8H7S370_9FUNG|nr:hypothetical protein INT45_014078 [Circinella minor]
MTDGTRFYIRQTGGQGRRSNYFARFEHFRVSPGDKECCSYDNYDCSDSADRNYEVKFWMRHHSTGGLTNRGYEITCPADGYIKFGGTYENPIIRVIGTNEEPYNSQIIHAYKNRFTYAKYPKNKDRDNGDNKKNQIKEDDDKEDQYDTNKNEKHEKKDNDSPKDTTKSEAQ